MTPDHEVVIVGAGFGGMGAAIAFDRLGVRDLVILEREDDLGGTWHVNRYPGLAVDIASVTYSYSFEPNPHWSRLFAPGEELKRYAEHVAEKYRLRSRMRFGVTVEGAQWDERQRLWRVRTADGAELTARYLVTATGFLSQPHTPDIPGMADFAGEVIHTAAWPERVELAGKRVAVIGTGATAVQLVPELARRAAELTVYQRTPIWVVPKVDGPIPAPVRALFARFPVAQRAARLVNTALLEALMVVGVLRYRKARPVAGLAARLGRWHLRRQVPDPVLRRALTPDYDFGCKRPTFSNTYYPALTRPHVRLVTEAIERIEPGGIVAGGVARPVDVLVLATGFDLWEVNFPAIAVTGRGGRELGAWWRETRFQAYEGITVPRFPNFLTLASPYSYSGLSYFTTIETQMRHIRRLFGEMARTGSRVFEVREDANERFLEKVTARLGDSVFYAGDCATARSYYFNQHGEAAILRPTSTVNALREAGRFPLGDYTYAR